MKIYDLHYRQRIPITIEQAWPFFSDPSNLKIITPDYMGFDILSGADRPMFEGQIIQYNVCPIAGIKTKWVTEITHVKEPEYFIDEQRLGPYSLWHHKHFIHKVEDGVEIEDLVHYKLPFGLVGQAVHMLIVKRKLKEIFDYRSHKMAELFGRL